MTTSPTIAVIIPTFNRRAILQRALASVFRQKHKADEIIVVDDGSTDQTAEMIGECFPSAKLIKQANLGVSAARNRGIGAAQSEWLAFLDSDDEWLASKLAKQLENLKANPEYKICHSEEIWIRCGARVNQKIKHHKSGGRIFRRCLPLCAISPSSVIIHRSIFTELGGFDESLPACEDYDLWLRVTSRFPVLFIDQPLIIKYGGHDDQLSKNHWGMDRYRIRALEKIVALNQLSPEDKSAALNMLVQKIEILLLGARKRNKTTDVTRYERLYRKYKDAASNMNLASPKKNELPTSGAPVAGGLRHP